MSPTIHHSLSTILLHRGALRVSGEDAAAFLQGLITNDIHKADKGRAVFAALLSPQGKFLHDFFIVRDGDGYLFDVEQGRIPDLVKRLTMYKLRSKVTIEDVSSQYTIAVAWGDAPSPNFYPDPRHAGLGWRAFAQKETVQPNADAAAYDLHRLKLGIPEGGKDLIPDRSLLLECGYDALNAVDFAKGCYVGQEVTARSKHRAQLRKYIHQVSAETSLPPSGTPVLADGKEAGEMRSSQGSIGLALLRLEEIEKAKELTAGGVKIISQWAAWLPRAEASSPQ